MFFIFDHIFSTLQLYNNFMHQVEKFLGLEGPNIAQLNNIPSGLTALIGVN